MTDMPQTEQTLTEDELLRQERTAACPLKNCPQELEDEMALRCIRTNRLMCMECAIHTPTGYIAKEVARAQDDKFYKGGSQDYVLAGLICGGGMVLATGILDATGILSVWIISIFVAPVIGTGLSEFALRVTQRRRGRHSDIIAAGTAAVGGILGAMMGLFLRVSNLRADMLATIPEDMQAEFLAENPDLLPDPLALAIEGTLTDIWLMLFIGIAAFTIYGRFKVRI
ncbi:MAG: hypothetical protein ACPG7F_20855 [Aggregatilineales bacterium]